MRKYLPVLSVALICATSAIAQPSLKKMQDAIRTSKNSASLQPQIALNEKMPALGAVNFPGKSFSNSGEAITWLKTQSGFRQGKDELLAQPSAEVTVRDIRIERYQQYYQGIKVEHGRVNLTSANGRISNMQLELYTIPEAVKTVPSLSEKAAFDKALGFVKATRYEWDNDPQRGIPKGELVWVEDILQKVGTVCLAYKFLISADEPLIKADVYVNAATGGVVFVDRVIKHAGPTPAPVNNVKSGLTKNLRKPFVNSAGAAQTRYSGAQALITDKRSDTSFHLREIRNSDSIVTLNYERRVRTAANDALAVDFNDLDNNWASTEYDNAVWDNAALDAHYGIEKVSDYWNQVHGRAGWDNKHGKLISYVHVRATANANYDNAAWNGVSMIYGDGTYLSGNTNGFLPLTALDVTAHELGHGICSSTANLTYQRESGGLNEGFSDIWGACVEHFSGLGGAKQNFLVGEEITPTRGFLRSMINPKLASNPSTYGGQFWYPTSLDGCPTVSNTGNDNCGVHNNSGVLNKWFYLITQGEAGTNDIGNRYSVTGLGFEKSERIAYLTELMLTPNSDFATTRQASINATTTLFGACSPEVIQVTNGWFAVGVGQTAACQPLVEFSTGALSVSEGGATLNTCSSKVFDIPVKLSVPASANLTLTFSAAGSAVLNTDYSFTTNTLTFAAGESGIKNFPITILDDGSNDGNKTLSISYSVNNSGGSGGQSPNNQALALTIVDDDVAPTRIGALPITVSTLLDEGFEATPGAIPAGWGQAVFVNLSGANKWIVGDKGGAGINGQAAYISSDTVNKSLVYSDTSITQRTLRTKAVSTTNLVNLKLSFKAKVDGEFAAPQPIGPNLYDYATLYYSLNGTSYFTLVNPATGYPYKFYGQGTNAFQVGPLNLPTALNNQATLYIGFTWINDLGYASNPPFLVDDIVLTGQTSGSAVKTTANQQGTTRVLAGAFNTYLYSTLDSQLIARISGVNENVGCVTSSVISQGNGKRVITGMTNYNATEKVVEISPAVANNTAGNTVYLYFTADELATWGAARNQLKIMKVKSGVDLSQSLSSADVQVVTPTSYVDNSATTGIIAYGGNFTGFSKYLLVEQMTALPVTLRNVKVDLRNQDARLTWETEVEVNNKGYEILRSFDGMQFEKIAFVDGRGNLTGISKYEYTDPRIPSNITVYYRLRQIDFDQQSMLSNIVSARQSNDLPSFSFIWPNPAGTNVNISFAAPVSKGKISVLSLDGKLMQQSVISTSTSLFKLGLTKIPSGVYLLKFDDGVRSETHKLIRK